MKEKYYCGYLDANCDKLKELYEENRQLKEKLRIDIQMTADLEVVRDAIKQKADFIKKLKELPSHSVNNYWKPGTILPGGTWCTFCKAELCRKGGHKAIDVEEIYKLIKDLEEKE